MLARIARWTIAHRRLAVVGWAALLVVVSAASRAAGTDYANDFSIPGTESQHARNLLRHDFPTQAGDSDQIVFRVDRGSVNDPAVRDRVQPMLARVASLPHVSAVVSPYEPTGKRAVSADRHTAFATVNFDQQANDLPTDAIDRVISTARRIRSPGLQVELGGQAIQQAQQPALGTATAVGLAAAIVILLITFGSVVAMGLPILTALLGLGTGVGLIALATRLINMPDFSTELAVMIGLGVGIDYSLFIVTRFRENHRREETVDEAIVGAMDSAGRAIVFAGFTVIIALMGMFALGIELLYGLAISASLTVLMTMLAALTVLPALLSRWGERIGRRRRAPRSGSAAGPDSRLWRGWAGLIQRHPWRGAIAGLAIVALLTAPLLSLRLGQSDAGNDPASLTTRRAYDLLADGFGRGFNGPLLVVASLPGSGDRVALADVGAALERTPDVASVSPPRVSPAGRTATFTVYPRSAPQDQATTDLVNRLRDDTLPPLERSTGTELLVGGAVAVQQDFARILSDKLPLFIAVVVLLSALLLLVVFRSLVIPVQAALMNLFSIGASLGVMVAIFQYGWLGGPLGVDGAPIEPFIPVLLFAIVFGLSMDYEVFLVSRVHEEWTRRRNPSSAMVEGLATTGRVITAAATIMICVFLSFVAGDERVLKLFGLSLATAVFLDAFVVRSLLLPSVLQLLGRRTWRIPAWLDRRLPHVAIDTETVAAESRRPTGGPAFEEV